MSYVTPLPDMSIYESQFCPECGKIILVAVDDPGKRKEITSLERHVCGDQGEPLLKRATNQPDDLGRPRLDNLIKGSI